MTTASMPSVEYHQKVAAYFDHEACKYEERYWGNPVVQRIRQSFREEVKAHTFGCALEIGCGVGLDLAHFASIYPDREIYGIDVSPAMVAHAAQKVQDFGLPNVRVELGTAEGLADVFPQVQFDHIYVFFGALNTVTDLPQVARVLRSRLKPGGTMVLTFVNKWYLTDMLLNLARFRVKRAFKRLHTVWGGYSDKHHLESRCFSPRQIRQAFGRDFRVTRRKGYSILYPAWYQVNWIQRFGRKLCAFLWDTDQVLNLTPAWCLGEYALYVFESRG